MGRKNPMALLFVCLMLGAMFAGTAYIARPNTVKADDLLIEEIEEPGIITVSGSSTLSSEPDQSIILLEVSAKEIKAVDARDKVAKILNSLFSKLRQLGLTNDDMQTTDYRISPVYEYINNERVFTGYRVVCSIKLTVKNLNNILRRGKIVTPISLRKS